MGGREGGREGGWVGGRRDEGRKGERERDRGMDRGKGGRLPSLTNRARQCLGTTMPSQCGLLAWLLISLTNFAQIYYVLN